MTEMSSDPDRPLEGPGSSRRLAALRAKFRGALHRADLGGVALLGASSATETKALQKSKVRIGYWLSPAMLGAGLAFGALAFLDLTEKFASPALAARHIAAAPHCATARATDLAPARRGDPGYWPWLDDDEDGVACERR